MKILLRLVILISTILTLAIIGTNGSYAQNQTQQEPTLNFTKLIQQKFSTAVPGIAPPNNTLPNVEVLYQSNKTLVLRGDIENFDSLGSVIDIAKQQGYSLDTVTVFTTTSSSSFLERTQSTSTDHYTVFMSRGK
jgi:hypothetical protein